MKHVLLLCSALVWGATLWGQNVPENLNQLTLDEKSWMRDIGFPIAQYDYSNLKINTELSTALEKRKKGKLFSTLSWVGLGTGAALLFIPKDGTSTGGKVMWAGSAGMMLGGLTLNLVGMSKKAKARKRIENARYLYNEK